jgi:uncharacterized protein DUF3106
VNFPLPKFIRLAICLGCGSWFSLSVMNAAQGPAPAGATNAPAPPSPKLASPVDTFRELLDMTPAQRKQALTNRQPEVQKRLMAKLREYESLNRNERELRLRATELQWHLLPLMRLSPTNRAQRLAFVPQEQRSLIMERLSRWDRLPPAMREEMLNNEMTARYFSQIEAAPNPTNILARMSPERRAKLEAGLNHWRGLSAEQRQKTLESFNAFFELTPREKERALHTLSETEQRQMEKTLQSYATLPSAQRAQCIESFEKFTGMSLAERQLFLKNAERWKLMSPAERAAWRKLVSYAPLQPPLPVPGQPASAQRTGTSLITNVN